MASGCDQRTYGSPFRLPQPLQVNTGRDSSLHFDEGFWMNLRLKGLTSPPVPLILAVRSGHVASDREIRAESVLRQRVAAQEALCLRSRSELEQSVQW